VTGYVAPSLTFQEPDLKMLLATKAIKQKEANWMTAIMA
jgi:hypothetical protein